LRVDRLFTVDRMVASFEALYEDLLDGRGSQRRRATGGDTAWAS
jgi:hypothetical protein